MEWEVREYIKQNLKNPYYSEPKWYAVDSTTTTIDFSVSAKYILLTSLIVSIIDGGAAGSDFTFVVNGIVLIRWTVGIGLQSDVKIIPLNYIVLVPRVVLTSSQGDFNIRIVTISER